MSEETKTAIFVSVSVAFAFFILPWVIAFFVLNGNHAWKWWELQTPLIEDGPFLQNTQQIYEDCEEYGGAYASNTKSCIISRP